MSRRKKEFVAPPPAPEVLGQQREEISLWMKDRLQTVVDEFGERIELLRTVGEHPSPIFQNIVRQHGALGMPKRLVARFLGMSESSLMKFYQEDYELGELSAIRAVAANAMRIGSSTTHPDAARVAIQVLDRRGGEEWKPPAQKLEVDDSRNKVPIIDSSKLTYEERQALRAMLERAAGASEDDPISEQESPKPGMDLIE